MCELKAGMEAWKKARMGKVFEDSSCSQQQIRGLLVLPLVLSAARQLCWACTGSASAVLPHTSVV